jgi:hypothetical protein
MSKYSLFLAVAMLFFSTANAQTQFIKYKKYLIPVGQSCDKPKVIVTTDYGPLSTSSGSSKGVGNSDANEAQDMVHFLAYSNQFDVRGLIVTKFAPTTSTSELDSVLTRYGNDSSFFDSSGIADFPAAADLKNVLYLGVDQQGSDPAPKSNAAIEHIKTEAANASPNCPVNILVWGAITDTAAAVYHMPANDRNNLRIIAIGSSNRTLGDPIAWDQISAFKVAGGTTFSQNIILSDGGSPDAFRSLFLGDQCPINMPLPVLSARVNPVLYNDSGIVAGVEDIMNDLTDNVSTSNSGLRGLLQKSRGSGSNVWLANRENCQEYATQSAISLRMGDSLTTMYLLDKVMGFNGALKQIIKDNNGTSSGTASHAVRRQIYEHYRARMNAIY